MFGSGFGWFGCRVLRPLCWPALVVHLADVKNVEAVGASVDVDARGYYNQVSVLMLLVVVLALMPAMGWC